MYSARLGVSNIIYTSRRLVGCFALLILSGPAAVLLRRCGWNSKLLVGVCLHYGRGMSLREKKIYRSIVDNNPLQTIGKKLRDDSRLTEALEQTRASSSSIPAVLSRSKNEKKHCTLLQSNEPSRQSDSRLSFCIHNFLYNTPFHTKVVYLYRRKTEAAAPRLTGKRSAQLTPCGPFLPALCAAESFVCSLRQVPRGFLMETRSYYTIHLQDSGRGLMERLQGFLRSFVLELGAATAVYR